MVTFLVLEEKFEIKLEGLISIGKTIFFLSVHDVSPCDEESKFPLTIFETLIAYSNFTRYAWYTIRRAAGDHTNIFKFIFYS